MSPLVIVGATAFLLCLVPVAVGLQCTDEQGGPVDWYVLYKLPVITSSKDYLLRRGLAYMYVTSESSDAGWTLSSLSVNDSRSIPGRTLSPLYDKNSSNVLYALYNDDPPSSSAGSTFGHTKGAILAEAKGGFWLVHSVPKFPIEPISSVTKKRNKYLYPVTASRYGQSFLCISLPANQLNVLGTQLMFNRPKIYSSNLPDTVSKQFVNLTLSVQGRYVRDPPWYQKAALWSPGGIEFTSYAKASAFGKDIYAGWVASDIGSDLQVETWSNGAGGELPSDCRGKFHVMDVLDVAVKVNNATTALRFKNSLDHSKWAISGANQATVCIGDINRMASQLRRGGGTVCFKNQALWNQYVKAIQDVQPCPINSGLGIFETLSGKPQVMDDPQLKGFKRYFNNETVTGRANVSKATIGLTIVAVIYYKLFHSKKTPTENA